MPTLIDLDLFLRPRRHLFSIIEQHIMGIIVARNGINSHILFNNKSILQQIPSIKDRYLRRIMKRLIYLEIVEFKFIKGQKYYWVNLKNYSKKQNTGTVVLENDASNDVKSLNTGTTVPITTGTVVPITKDESLYMKEWELKNNKKIFCSSDDERIKSDTLSNLPPGEEKMNKTAERFDEFWKAYPRKVGKKKAMTIWLKRNLDSLADEIISHLSNRSATDITWQEKQFIPHPTTFLNGDRWEDEILTNGERFNGPRLAKPEVDTNIINIGNGEKVIGLTRGQQSFYVVHNRNRKNIERKERAIREREEAARARNGAMD